MYNYWFSPRFARGEPGSQDGLPATRAAAYRRIKPQPQL